MEPRQWIDGASVPSRTEHTDSDEEVIITMRNTPQANVLPSSNAPALPTAPSMIPSTSAA